MKNSHRLSFCLYRNSQFFSQPAQDPFCDSVCPSWSSCCGVCACLSKQGCHKGWLLKTNNKKIEKLLEDCQSDSKRRFPFILLLHSFSFYHSLNPIPTILAAQYILPFWLHLQISPYPRVSSRWSDLSSLGRLNTLTLRNLYQESSPLIVSWSILTALHL